MSATSPHDCLGFQQLGRDSLEAEESGPGAQGRLCERGLPHSELLLPLLLLPPARSSICK